MPISPTAPPVVSDLPTAPNDTTQTVSEFNAAANDFVEAQVDIVPEYNELADWQNDTAQEVYDNAVEASDSASNAALSAEASAAASNWIGIWSDLTGPVSVGESVTHEAAQWRAAVAIADITLSEPSPTNSDWVFVSGNTFLKITSSTNVIPNSKFQISATSAAVDVTLVPMNINDSSTLRNNSNSTEKVRLVNTTYTIIGNVSTITSSDNIVLPAARTIILVCRDTNILEIL